MPSGRYDFDDDGPAKPNRMFDFRNPKVLIVLLIMLAVAVLLMVGNQYITAQPEKLTWEAMKTKLQEGKIEELVVYTDGDQGEYYGTLTGLTTNSKRKQPFVVIDGMPWKLLSEDEKKSISAAVAAAPDPKPRIIPGSPSNLRGLLPVLFLIGILGVAWYFLIFRYRSPSGPGGVLSFGKSRATLVTKEKATKTFADVAGIEEAKEEVQEIITFLKDPRRFQRLGGRVPKGVLLMGAPGTGKTLLAKAIAGEAGVPFYAISGSDFVEMFVGVGASRVRDLFQQAKINSPCVIFLDEIDAVGRRRGTGLGGGHDEREQTLNAILVEMDGFESDNKIVVIAATNRPDVLDPALLRPGRFDRHIVIDPPDLNGRQKILEVYARKIKLDEDVDLEKLARMTPSFTGANIESMMNEAAISAVLKDKDSVEMVDLEEARDKVLWGREKRSRKIGEDDRELTAIHEGGHAVVAMLTPEVEPLHKVTIISRGHYLGATMQLPVRDEYSMSRKKILGEMRVLFGGRSAEEIFGKDISSGAAADIRRATEIARRMICEWGMSDALGPVNYETAHENVFLGYEGSRSREYSESTARRIDEEVRKLISTAHAEARKLLEEHREATERVKQALLDHEVLNREQVEKVMAGEKLPDAVKPAGKNAVEPEAAKEKAPEGDPPAATADGDRYGIREPQT